jgi:hypothetical protein
MLKDLNIFERELAHYMSQISEEAYSAGWFTNLEYILWNAVIGGKREFGRHFISDKDIENLTFISSKCNSWIIFDDKNDETAINLEEWKKMFSEVDPRNWKFK